MGATLRIGGARGAVALARYAERTAAAVAVAVLVLGPSALAQPADPEIQFRIPAGSVASVLTAYAAQSGDQLLYSTPQVAGLMSPGLIGRFPASVALGRLLSPTGLVGEPSGPRVWILRPAPLTPAAAATGPARSVAGPRREDPAPVDEVVVTGTLIRGVRDGLSPSLRIDGEAFDRSGTGSATEVLAGLPQDFKGQATVATAVLLADTRAANDTLASGVNLRGLGAQSTLVLVDGRRMAGAGSLGDFGDVSAVPTIAVSHAEVLLDGASALLGSDAVGGVVNLVLRRPFDGTESRLRLASTTQGGGGSAQVGLVSGRIWPNGGLVLGYEAEHQQGLVGAGRESTRTSDLRSLGGTDRRVIFAHPGNLVTFDAAANTYAAVAAIPEGQSGLGLRPEDFELDRVNLQNPRLGASLYPKLDRQSLYLRLDQAAQPDLRTTLAFRFSRRMFEFRRPASMTVLTVDRGNPFFPAGERAAQLAIAYSFADEAGPMLTQGSAESLGLSGGLVLDMPRGWRLALDLSHATETGRRVVSNQLNRHFLREALGAVPDDPATAFAATRDGYFNPFGAAGANSARVIGFVMGGYSRAVSASTVDVLDLKADGAATELPAGPLKMAVGGQLRFERFEPRSTGLLSGSTPISGPEVSYSRRIAAAFLELRAPLAGPDGPLPFTRRLDLTLAGRLERYDDLGVVGSPQAGLGWAAAPHISISATYGAAFRAPNLVEVHGARTVSESLIPAPGGQVAVVALSGGDPDLKPEHARTWTASIRFEPSSASGAKVSATWFKVVSTGQVGAPVLADAVNALTNPAYAPFVRWIDPAKPADLAYVKALLADPSASALFPAEAVGAVVDARSANAARLEAEGVDLAASAGRSTAWGRLEVEAEATYLRRYDRRLTPAAPWERLVNTPGNPLALRARVALTWTGDALAVTTAVRYANAYKAPAGRRIGAWTTVDLQARWRVRYGPLKGSVLSVSASNAFDRPPPFYDNPLGVGYDPANADPVGRSVALQLSRCW